MRFDEWYDSEFGGENEWKDRREECRAAWLQLEHAGANAEAIARSFSRIVEVARDQYGD